MTQLYLKSFCFLRKLRHPNVIQLIGYTSNDTDLLMVMNCVKGCNLSVALGLKKLTTNDSAKVHLSIHLFPPLST